jgi:glycine/D-amino acid oxidase-like deaminating enzyme
MSSADGMSRRDLLATGVALGAAAAGARAARARGPAAGRGTAIVVGAGAFGGWSALELRRRGWDVTLVEAWGPGHSRASSGGETRVIRGSYGERGVYTRLTARALERWRELDRERGTRLFQPAGVLWLAGAADEFIRASLPHLAAAGIAHERLDAAAGARRWPQIDWSGLAGALFEPASGFLFARRACAEVAAAFAEAGGRLVHAEARPALAGGRGAVVLASGERLEADLVLFACGPWLPRLFPELLGGRIRPTRQEVFFFGAPAGDRRFEPPALPVWADPTGERFFYGIPGNEARGFKVADDTHGVEIDPSSEERVPSAAALERARELLARRFPALAGAPLVEARVCQYEVSPDSHLVFDRHPEAANLWVLGGGSGHGFKLGPALGEHVAAALAGEVAPEPAFALARFATGAR